MENFKTLLDDYNLDQISQELSQFLHSADGYENRLKLTHALLGLINESCVLLKTVDLNDFISEIRKRIEDTESLIKTHSQRKNIRFKSIMTYLN